jgi:hypothetical protein
MVRGLAKDSSREPTPEKLKLWGRVNWMGAAIAVPSL